MSIEFVRGDLFQWPGLRAFGHGCNCAGAMGKGIAVEFRRRFPAMFVEYKRRCADGSFKPGDVFAWTEGDLTVFNLGTQATWKTRAELPFIEAAVVKAVSLAEQMGIAQVGLPRIGAGLGGLPWGPVKAALSRIGVPAKVSLLVFEEYTPARSGSAPPR